MEDTYEYTNVPVRFNHKIVRFPTLKEARDFCIEHKNQAAILFDTLSRKWMTREQARLENTYVSLPLAFQATLNRLSEGCSQTTWHFAHMAADKENVAYTPNHEYGVCDRQVIISPGRYLKKFFGDYLSDKEIRSLVDDFKAFDDSEIELKFGDTREDFQFAYNGQQVCALGSSYVSCMAPTIEDEWTNIGFHPAEVYAAGDLQIAYLIHKNSLHTILARAVCFREKRRHSYIYAINHKYGVMLDRKLREQGLSKNPDFTGAKILRLVYQKDKYYTEYVMPYIDGNMKFAEIPNDKKHFILGQSDMLNSRYADSTSGTTYL